MVKVSQLICISANTSRLYFVWLQKTEGFSDLTNWQEMACVLIYSAQLILGSIYPGSHRTKYIKHEGDCYGVSQSQEEKASFKQLVVTVILWVVLILVQLPDIAEDGDHGMLLSSLFCSSAHSRDKL